MRKVMLNQRKILSKDQLKEKIIEVSELHGDFLLRSGMRSDHYFDKYLFESNPDLLFQICWQIKQNLDVEFDYFAGLEMGGIPIATMLGQLMQKPVIFVRKKAKKYGTMKLAEGPDIAGKRICIVEDVVTTAGQVVQSAQKLKALDAQIVKVACVILRNQKGLKSIDKAGLSMYNLFDFSVKV